MGFRYSRSLRYKVTQRCSSLVLASQTAESAVPGSNLKAKQKKNMRTSWVIVQYCPVYTVKLSKKREEDTLKDKKAAALAVLSQKLLTKLFKTHAILY